MAGGLYNPLIHQTATIIIAASNSLYPERADYQCPATAAQAVINAALATGRRVLLLEGDFNINAPITAAVSDLTLEGCGRGTIITLANGSDCNVITVGGDGWSQKDFTIDGNKANQSAGVIHGIYAAAKHDGFIFNVHATNCGFANESGTFFFDGCNRWRIGSCVTENGEFYGIQIEGCTDFLIENCISRSNDTPGFGVDGSSYVHFSNCSGISNGYCNWSIGETTACYSVSIVNCHSRDVQDGSGIRIKQSWYCSIVGCTSYQDGAGVLRAGLHTWGGGHHTITGNTVYNSGSYGLYIESSTVVAVVGNVFSETYYHGISIETSTFLTITGNTFQDIGTSGTMIGVSFDTVEDTIISGNIFEESRAGAARFFYWGVRSGWGTTGSKRINVSDNIFNGMVTSGVASYSPADSDDWVITDNIFVSIATAILVAAGNGTGSAVDWIIQGNRFDACTTPININIAGATRTLVIGNDWQGSTNDPSYGAATTPRFNHNIDKNGAWWSVNDGQPTTRNFILTAAGGWPSTTNGCAPNALTEYAGNDQDLYSLDFNTGADEFAQWTIVLPNDYNAGTITAMFYWTCVGGGGGETVKWYLQGLAYADNDPIDAAWGGAVGIADTWIADGDVHHTATTAAITIGGGPAAGELCQFRIYRDVSEDDLGVDAKLLAIKINYTGR